MKRILLASVLMLPMAAHAADLPTPYVKAPPRVTGCTVTSCISWFVGGSMANAGGSLDILGAGLTGLAQNGFGMGGQAGYEFFSNKFYFAALMHAESDLALNAMPGTKFSDRATWGVCGRVGYSLSGLLGSSAASSGAAPTLPAELLASLMTPYLNVCEDKRHNQPAIVSGAGVEALLAANPAGRSAWTLNVDYLHYNYNQGGNAGVMGVLPITQTSDNVVKASLNYHFGY